MRRFMSYKWILKKLADDYANELEKNGLSENLEVMKRNQLKVYDKITKK